MDGIRFLGAFLGHFSGHVWPPSFQICPWRARDHRLWVHVSRGFCSLTVTDAKGGKLIKRDVIEGPSGHTGWLRTWADASWGPRSHVQKAGDGLVRWEMRDGGPPARCRGCQTRQTAGPALLSRQQLRLPQASKSHRAKQQKQMAIRPLTV